MKNFLIFLFILYVQASFGQPDSLWQKVRKNNLVMGIGLIHPRLIDDGFTQSKLLFRGTNFKFRLCYGQETAHHIFNFSSEISAGNINTKENKLSADFVNVTTYLEYLSHIKSGKQHHFFAGLQVSTTNYIMQNESIFDNIDIFSLHGIYFNFSDKLYLNKKQSLQFTYSIPTMVYENHVLWNGGASNYTFSDRENLFKLLTTHGKLSYFNLFRTIQFKAYYLKKIGKNTDFEVKYQFFYATSFIESPYVIYSNELFLNLKINF